MMIYIFGEETSCKKAQSPILIPPLPYSPEKTTKTEMVDFSNQWTGQSCNMSKCELRSSDCLSSYVGTNLFFSNFKVMGSQNIVGGYKEQVCLMCRDDSNTVFFIDSLTFE